MIDHRAIGASVNIMGNVCEIIDVDQATVTVILPNGNGHVYGRDGLATMMDNRTAFYATVNGYGVKVNDSGRYVVIATVNGIFVRTVWTTSKPADAYQLAATLYRDLTR